MNPSLILDQPNVAAPERSRRFEFGASGGERVAILNGRAKAFEGGGDEPELSLKWVPAGAADYRIGRTQMHVNRRAQLLLNRGQPYRLRLSQESETFVVFWSRGLADAAWQAFSSSSDAFPEVPAVSGRSHAALEVALAVLGNEANSEEPQEAALRELSLSALAEVAVLAAERRGSLARIPALKRATREELLRRIARAEGYLIDARGATLEGAADAAALSPFHLLRASRGASRNAAGLGDSQAAGERARCADYDRRLHRGDFTTRRLRKPERLRPRLPPPVWRHAWLGADRALRFAISADAERHEAP